MKLKSIHIILIIVLVIEIIVLSAVLIKKKPNNTATQSESIKLPVTYETNENGEYKILSIFDTLEEPIISFKYNDNTYVFDHNIIDVVESEQNYDKFAKLQPDATKEMWDAYKEAVAINFSQVINTEHSIMQYIRNIASSWYGVNKNLLHQNNGFYTLNSTTTIAKWESVFSKYRIQQNNQAANEMAIGATVKIDDMVYPAIAYMVISDDGNTENNSEKQEVSIYVVFGDKFIEDMNNKTATICYYSPDGSTQVGHSEMKVNFFASLIESKYREMSIIGGEENVA